MKSAIISITARNVVIERRDFAQYPLSNRQFLTVNQSLLIGGKISEIVGGCAINGNDIERKNRALRKDSYYRRYVTTRATFVNNTRAFLRRARTLNVLITKASDINKKDRLTSSDVTPLWYPKKIAIDLSNSRLLEPSSSKCSQHY